jgi:hypothetical protein
MLRHRDTRSTERYARLGESALVEAFGAQREWTLRRRERAQGVLMSRNRARKHRRNQVLLAGRTGLEPEESDDKSPE